MDGCLVLLLSVCAAGQGRLGLDGFPLLGWLDEWGMSGFIALTKFSPPRRVPPSRARSWVENGLRLNHLRKASRRNFGETRGKKLIFRIGVVYHPIDFFRTLPVALLPHRAARFCVGCMGRLSHRRRRRYFSVGGGVGICAKAV